MAVRPATSGDAIRIAELLTELGYPAVVDEVAERLVYWLPDQASRLLVAETGAHAFYRRLGFDDACERSARFIKELEEST